MKVVDDILASARNLELGAQGSGNPIDFDNALQELSRADEHINRTRNPEQQAAINNLRSSLVQQRQTQVEQRQAQARDLELTRQLDEMRTERMIVETEENLFLAPGRPLWRLLNDNGIALGVVSPEELANRIRQRPHACNAIRDALVECYTFNTTIAEAVELHEVLVHLEDHPDVRPVLTAARTNPDQLAESEFAARLNRLPPIYTLVAAAVLKQRNQYDAAVRVLRRGVLRAPDHFWLHYHLGHLYITRVPASPGLAVMSYWAALGLRKDCSYALLNLGCCLIRNGQVDEGLLCLERACQRKPDLALYHRCYANGLRQAGRHQEAKEKILQALQLQPDSALNLRELGHIELETGNMADAIATFKKALSRAPQNLDMRTQLLGTYQQLQHLVRFKSKLSTVLERKTEPVSAAEAGNLMELCYLKGKHLDAYRLSQQSFARFPGMEAERRSTWYRFNAACYAALVAAGKGDGAAQLSIDERRQARVDALAWLQVEYAELKQMTEKGSPRDRFRVHEAMVEWLSDSTLASVRDIAMIREFPPEERKAWRVLWSEVEWMRDRLVEGR